MPLTRADLIGGRGSGATLPANLNPYVNSSTGRVDLNAAASAAASGTVVTRTDSTKNANGTIHDLLEWHVEVTWIGK